MASEPLQVTCPSCGVDNPLGFVWCRKCKGALTLPRRKLRWPFPPAVTGGLVGGALVAAIFLASRREPNIPPDVAGGAPAAVPSSRDSKKALESWATGGTKTKPGAPDPTLIVTQDPDPTSDPASSDSPVVGGAPETPAATAAAAPRAQLVGVHQDGEKLTYDISVDVGGKRYPVKVSGHIEQNEGRTEFVPDEVDTGDLPVDDSEVERMLGEAFSGKGRRNGGAP